MDMLPSPGTRVRLGTGAAPSVGAAGATGCQAPSMHLYLAPNGEVRACCNNQQPLGWVPHDRLGDIWRGHRRAALVAAIHRNDFSQGCWTCEDEARIEGRDASYAAVFDHEPPAGPDGWPTFVEFNLSNRCNLRCVQCNPELSSSIRALTDLPPVPAAYGDEFFEDLREFLPHLHRAQFAGGEPFLAPENYRVWDLVAELAPGLDVTVVTNATHLTDRAREVLERVPMSIVVSLDGASATTFESIRRGASFEQVVDHVDWFVDYTRRVGTRCSVNHCLMPQNVREYGDLLCLAEDRGLAVQVSVVRAPAECALGTLPTAEIEAVVEHLQSEDGRLRGRLVRNLAVWERELARLTSWAGAAESVRAEAFDRTRADVVALFPQPGAPVAVDAVRDELRASSNDGIVHELLLDRSLQITADVSGFGAVVGSGLEGRSTTELGVLMERRFGALRDRQRVRDDQDGIEVRDQYAGADWRAVLLPLRDVEGWTVQVQWLAVRTGRDGT